jgi:hypothetical protein
MTIEPGFTCRLCLRSGTDKRAHRASLAGEVELENRSRTELALRVTTHPLQYLDLIVTGPDGGVVSEFHYGNLFSPPAEPYTWLLQPGERYVAPVALLGNVPPAHQRPGWYTVRAVYEFPGGRSESDPLRVYLDEPPAASAGA